GNCTECHVRESVQGSLVHLVQRTIHQTREVAFDEEILPDKKSHEISDGASTERNKRAKVAIDVWLQRFSSQPPKKLLDEMRRLLMGGLSPRWNVASAAWLRAGRAIADRKNVGIASSLKSRGNDELAYPVGL